MNFGNKVHQVRKSKKISQIELAKLVGIHGNVLGRYERGLSVPSIEMATKLANALNTSLDYLVGNTDIELDQAMIDKILIIQKLSGDDQKHIMYAIEALIQHALNRKAYRS